jgi:hypothetical protein
MAIVKGEKERRKRTDFGVLKCHGVGLQGELLSV